MKQEEKQLLIKDLCARLPYSIWGLHRGEDLPLYVIDNSGAYMVLGYNAWFNLDTIPFKPYLRPMSSMTEEENAILNNISNKDRGYEEDENGWVRCDSIHTKWGVWPDGCAKLLDYLNSIHIDYRGLIPMGLALEAPEGMYNIK